MKDDNYTSVRVITDSNSGISPEQGRKQGIGVVPMPFFVDGKEYFEEVSITRDDFFRCMAQGAEISTSQPSPEGLTELWTETLKLYDEIVYIPMSGGLSGSVMTAKYLAEEFGGRVQVVDNRRISCTQKMSVLQAAELARQGKSALEIRQRLEAAALDCSIYIAVDTLTYLKKGGRVTPAGAAIATMLSLKPVLQIQGDKLDAYAKVRGMKAAQEKMLAAVEADMNGRFAGRQCSIKGAFTCTRAEAKAWRSQIAERFPRHKISLDPLPLSISCHIGPGSMAIVCIPRSEDLPHVTYEI